MRFKISEKTPLSTTTAKQTPVEVDYAKLLVPALAVVVALIALVVFTTTFTTSGAPNLDRGDAKVGDILDRTADAVLREDEGGIDCSSSWTCLAGISYPLRDNGQDIECYSEDEGVHCVHMCPSLPSNPLVCGDVHIDIHGFTGYDRAGHWCQKAQETCGGDNDCSSWTCIDGISYPLRHNGQDIECYSEDEGVHCVNMCPSLPSNPLVCGDVHADIWGFTGYNTTGHWCQTAEDTCGLEEDEIEIEIEGDFEEDDFTFENIEVMLDEDPERFTMDFDPDLAVLKFDLKALPALVEFVSEYVDLPTFVTEDILGELEDIETYAELKEKLLNEVENKIDELKDCKKIKITWHGPVCKDKPEDNHDYDNTGCAQTVNTCGVMDWIDGVSDATDDVLKEALCIFDYVEKLYELDQKNDQFNDYVSYLEDILPDIARSLGVFTGVPYVGGVCKVGKLAAEKMRPPVKKARQFDDKIQTLLSPVEPLRNFMDELIINITKGNDLLDTTEMNVNTVRLAVVDHCSSGINEMETASGAVLGNLPSVIETVIQDIADRELAPACDALTSIKDLIGKFDDILDILNPILDPFVVSIKYSIGPVVSKFGNLLNKKFCAKKKFHGVKIKICKKLKRIIDGFNWVLKKINKAVENLIKNILRELGIPRDILELDFLRIKELEEFNVPNFGDLNFGLAYDLMPDIPGINIDNPCDA